jgi:hypothetical protein
MRVTLIMRRGIGRERLTVRGVRDLRVNVAYRATTDAYRRPGLFTEWATFDRVMAYRDGV